MATLQNNYFVHTLLRARDWQHRPQFDQVCDWWRSGGRGVCALVGMGGAGKTAIADRFLNELLDDTSTTRERESPPHGVFVYSFYDDDKPESFFRHLQIWLEGTSAPDKVKSSTQLMFDIQQHQGLIILDGLEKVQESGARGGFGRLTSPSLRDLLNHIACGSARELSVLATSRFPLTDLRDSHPRFFHTIAIDQIDVAAGIALLRARGVRGTDVQLAPIVEHCGWHALTIDLAGGYIKEYGHGDPATPLNLGTAEELQDEAEQEPDDDRRAVLMQGIRFARIAQRYREAMLSSDEAVLALLERICLFRLGVDCETLAAIFTGPAAEKVAGTALASLDGAQLQRKLDWLVKMRIVETVEPQIGNGNSEFRYTIHPAVRDGFLSGLDPMTARLGHERVCQVLEQSASFGPKTIAKLGGRPGGEYPSDSAKLDLYEEIVYHTLQAGRSEAAWHLYWEEIGNFENLGQRLGDYQRGERICRCFADTPSPNSACLPLLSTKYQIHFLNEWALYLQALGCIDGAKSCFDRSNELSLGINDWRELKIGKRNEASLLIDRGFLIPSLPLIAESLKLAEHRYDLERMFAYEQDLWSAAILRGRVRELHGDLAPALADFRRAEEIQQHIRENDLPLVGFGGVYYGSLLVRLGKFAAARKVCVSNLDAQREERQTDASRISNKTNLVLAESSLQQGDLATSNSLVNEARDWAVGRDAKQALCWFALVHSRIAIANAHKHEAQASGSTRDLETHSLALRACTDAINQGLKIARDCGYGLYHIDLLLERARLHLLRGDPGAALADIKVALGDSSGGGGIPANEETGQVELLAANHKECGYAWAIPAGLQLRAEALLLQAAQQLGRTELTEPMALATDFETDAVGAEPDASAFGSLEIPGDIVTLIDQAKQHLREALDLWQLLHDPEPERDDQNFKLDGKEYNYKAAETHRILTDLEGGVLPRYPLGAITEKEQTVTMPVRENAFISYSHADAEWRDMLLKNLKPLVRTGSVTAWSDQQIKPGSQWYDEIQRALAATKVAVFLVTADFLASDFIWKEELKPLLEEADKGNVTILWVPVKASLVEATDLPKYQALGDPDKPLNGMTEAERDQASVNICKTIRDALNA